MDLQSKALLRFPKVSEVTGLKHSCIYDRIKKGTFPAPVKLGGRLVAWRASDIEAWIDSLSQSDNSQAAE